MKFALISVTKETTSGSTLIGMQSLFDSSVLENQVCSALEVGAERIFLLSEAISGPLLQYVDQLNQQGVVAEIIRSGSELVAHASDGDLVIFFGDGILPDSDFNNRLKTQSNELIYVVENADNYEAFERIDLEHRWLGVAVLKAVRLMQLVEIPEDWDIGSALLRTAVQGQVARQIVSEKRVSSGAIVQLGSETVIEQFTQQKLGSSSPKGSGILDRFVVWPMMRRALKPLWKNQSSSRYLTGLSIASGTVAGVFAYFQWPIVSISLLIASSLAIKQQKALAIFSQRTTNALKPDNLFAVISVMVLSILTLAMSPNATFPQNIVIVLALLMLLRLTVKTISNSKLSMFRPDFLLVFLTLLLAASIGQVFAGFYVSLLWASSFLFIESFIVDSDLKN